VQVCSVSTGSCKGEEPFTMTITATATLKEHLLSSLKIKARGKRAFKLDILRSQARRSYALFPWASDANAKVYVEYELIILSEKAPDTPA
jgi:hypothetical protein